MRTKRIITSYYIVSALISASAGFIMGVYSNFLRSAGLDEFWINMVNVVYFITITICEIPTGLFADIFGRKSSLVISCFLETISFIVYGWSRSFTGFALAEGIGAIGRTFASGAFSAWLVDSLHKESTDHDLKQIFARRGVISGLATIIAAVIGGWIGDKGLNLPFYAGGFLFLTTGIIAVIVIKENEFERTKFSFVSGLKEVKDTWHRSLSFAKNDISFRFILVTGAVQMFAVMAPNMEWQKIFQDLGFSNSWNGLFAGLIIVAIMTGSFLSHKFGKLVKKEKSQLVLSQIFTGACIALTVSFANTYPVLIIFFLHEISRGVTGPVMESFTQKCITSPKERATLGSFSSMAGHFGGALGLLVSGLIAKYAGIRPAWIVSGSILIIATLLVARSHKEKTG